MTSTYLLLLLLLLLTTLTTLCSALAGGAQKAPSKVGPMSADSSELYQHSHNYVYYRYSNVNWERAQAYCQDSETVFNPPVYGTNLASLSSVTERDNLQYWWQNPLGWDFTQADVRDNLVFVGLRRGGDGVWRWLDGHVLDTSIISWAPGYPTSTAGADCGRLVYPDMTLANTMCNSIENAFSGRQSYFLCRQFCMISVNCESGQSGCEYHHDTSDTGSYCNQCKDGHTYVDVFEDRCLDCNIQAYHGQVLCAHVNTDANTCLNQHLCCPEHWGAADLCFKPN